MVKAVSLLLILAELVSANVQSQEILYTDIGVTLSAAPTTGLRTGQPINVSVTATNYGPTAVPFLELNSSTFVNEFGQFVTNPDECFLFATVVDAVPVAYYYINWDVANVYGQGTPPFDVGESKTCHFQMSLTSAAPMSTTFSFGVSTYFSDIDPSNDVGSVTLVRAPAAPSQVPATSLSTLVLLFGLIAVLGLRSRKHVSSPPALRDDAPREASFSSMLRTGRT